MVVFIDALVFTLLPIFLLWAMLIIWKKAGTQKYRLGLGS
jgi:hypothetical protein